MGFPAGGWRWPPLLKTDGDLSVRIVQRAIKHPDGRVTDEEGNALSFDEQLFVDEFITPDGKDMYDRMYEAGYRMARDANRRVLSAILGSGDKSFGMAELVER